MKRTRLFVLMLVLVLAASFFAGCATTEDPAAAPAGADSAAPAASEAEPAPSAAGGDKTIAMLLQTLSFKRYPDGDVPYFEERCKELGYTPVVHAASDDSETQIQQAESVITQGVDAIVLQACSDAAAFAILEMAQTAGIPVVAYNDPVMDVELQGFVGRDNVGMWKGAAEKFVEMYPSGNYVLCNGDESYMAARGFQEGYSSVVYAVPEINVVSDQWNDEWSAESTMAQVEAALTANNDDIQAIVCANDPMATGAMQALEGAGLLGKVGLVGCDLELNVAQAIVEGKMDFTCFTEYGQMGSDAADLAVAIIEGKDLPSGTTTYDNGYDIPYIATPHVYVGADNMAQFIKDHPWWFTVEEVYANVPQDQWPEA